MELHLTKKDFDVDWFSGTGGGGQHRNKHMNCCRITHRDSGLRAQSTRHRDRPANQKEAFHKLVSLLIAHLTHDTKPAARAPDETVRTYHQTRNIVTDHASGATMPYKKAVVKGDMAPMIEARRRSSDGRAADL